MGQDQPDCIKGSASHRMYPNAHGLARAAAEHIATLATEAIGARGLFAVALSGGSTPRATYALLASGEFAAQVDWSHVHVFWGDERCVSPDHRDSNYRMAKETLLDHVSLPVGNVHRIRGEMEPEAAAQTYAAELLDFFGTPWPSLDLVLLGMGSDGHVASLFPGSAALCETARPVVAVTAEYQDCPVHRVTLTGPAINASRRVVFLVAGAAKAETLRAVWEGPMGPLVLSGLRTGPYPAQQIRPTSGKLIWLVDVAAASRLKKRV